MRRGIQNRGQGFCPWTAPWKRRVNVWHPSWGSYLITKSLIRVCQKYPRREMKSHTWVSHWKPVNRSHVCTLEPCTCKAGRYTRKQPGPARNVRIIWCGQHAETRTPRSENPSWCPVTLEGKAPSCDSGSRRNMASWAMEPSIKDIALCGYASCHAWGHGGKER